MNDKILVQVKKSDEAYKDFLKGMSLKKIAKKYSVKYNTVRLWSSKFNWRKRDKNVINESIKQVEINKQSDIQDIFNQKLSIEGRINKLIFSALDDIENDRTPKVNLDMLYKLAKISDSSSNILKILDKASDKQDTSNKIKPLDVRNYIADNLESLEEIEENGENNLHCLQIIFSDFRRENRITAIELVRAILKKDITDIEGSLNNDLIDKLDYGIKRVFELVGKQTKSGYKDFLQCLIT